MEKIIYALWRRDGESRETFNARLAQEAQTALLGLPEVLGLRINYQDGDVVRAEPLRQISTDPQMDAIVQIWTQVSHAPFRAPIDAVLESVSSKIAAWAVLESAVIPNREHPPVLCERTAGWSQMCFLQIPESLEREEWRQIWQDTHTEVGRDTQSNFEYIQNYIVRALIPGPVDYGSIVEECFPTDAMDDERVFFNSVGDDALHAENVRRMFESCARFLVMPGGVDAIPTSQYDYRKMPG